ncbi:MAG TPA: bifunctional tetrahydrofolate synthase/dihydrofolate synthase [Burkholderiales bacterium]|nr:bifunctional tetrahydrofolate synthase/dihydrofolate synthase [Burkholderiales bacterium]
MPENLDAWLKHIEGVHPRAVEMGLERVTAVRHALHLTPDFPIITVGGTNGKGSACAMLEAVLHQAGYKTGCYISPHLLRYNERVRLAREDAADEALSRALAAVEAARGAVPLTYFEFSTLAAVWLFVVEKVDVALLEVGLGGRLDAVNAFDGDCAMLMSVELDHMDYLGNTREAIGFEKAGIFRARRPAICAERNPPDTVLKHAQAIGAELLVIGRDFGYDAQPRQWKYWGPKGERHGLPHPALRGEYQLANAAASVAALDTLRDKLPVTAGDVRTGLLTASNPGRFQVLPGRPEVILDVAHNPAAARALADTLQRMPRPRRTYAVFAMLADKDIEGVIDAVKKHVDEWHVAGIAAERGTDAATLANALARRAVYENVSQHATIVDAYAQACDKAAENDRILVFGSFYTVAAVMSARGLRP